MKENFRAMFFLGETKPICQNSAIFLAFYKWPKNIGDVLASGLSIVFIYIITCFFCSYQVSLMSWNPPVDRSPCTSHSLKNKKALQGHWLVTVVMSTWLIMMASVWYIRPSHRVMNFQQHFWSRMEQEEVQQRTANMWRHCIWLLHTSKK